MPTPTKPPLWRRMVLAFWRVSLVVTAFLWLHPVSYRSTRMAIVGLLFFIWGGALMLWWRLMLVRLFALGVASVVVLVIVWPGRLPDTAQLRSNYVKSLVAYGGTKYV